MELHLLSLFQPGEVLLAVRYYIQPRLTICRKTAGLSCFFPWKFLLDLSFSFMFSVLTTLAGPTTMNCLKDISLFGHHSLWTWSIVSSLSFWPMVSPALFSPPKGGDTASLRIPWKTYLIVLLQCCKINISSPFSTELKQVCLWVSLSCVPISTYFTEYRERCKCKLTQGPRSLLGQGLSLGEKGA